MKKWFPVLAGLVTGIILAGWLLPQNPRPAIYVFLQKPLLWLFSYIDSLRIIPHESLGGLIIIIPLWFIYWACLGALVGLLLRLSFCQFREWRHSGDSQCKSPENPANNMRYVVTFFVCPVIAVVGVVVWLAKIIPHGEGAFGIAKAVPIILVAFPPIIFCLIWFPANLAVFLWHRRGISW